ncbi:glycosyltransferase [Anaerosporobacter sp.]|uniref:glycosyltransferase n=1 Tax=Anaerosporobacter sp. TaxID=1872529 RepID=UPI00286EE860|nr:glycosyltransferase [Anaerosporobacter sp.]
MRESNGVKYSVLMSLYEGEEVAYLKESIESMLAQTYPADEIVVVKDGPLTKALETTLDEFESNYKGQFKFVKLEKNEGLGPALKAGISACRNEWIVRMDADDVAVPNRCERQIQELDKQPDLDMICSNYYEFHGDKEDCVLRNSPEKHEEIIKFARRRNPFGHCCMMYRKSRVLEAGNYGEHFPSVEDYDLWIRMFMKGCRCYNIQEPLVYVRGNKNFYGRRGGVAYWRKIMNFFSEYRRQGFFGWKDYLISCTARTIVYLFPVGLRTFIYRTMLREKANRG